MVAVSVTVSVLVIVSVAVVVAVTVAAVVPVIASVLVTVVVPVSVSVVVTGPVSVTVAVAEIVASGVTALGVADGILLVGVRSVWICTVQALSQSTETATKENKLLFIVLPFSWVAAI